MGSLSQKSALNGPSNRIWYFGECQFDESRYELRVRGSVVELESKPLDVLHQLLLRSGDVVRKEDLLEAVWPGVIVVDASLATAVSKLRKVLGGDEAVIKTVPKIGYRLSVPVRCEFTPAPPVATEPAAPSEPAPAPRVLRRPQLGWWIAAVVLVTVTVSLTAFRKANQPPRKTRTVAILPFQNVGADHSTDYLRAALPDEIANTLTAARSLELRPLAATSRYTDPVQDMRKLGRDLNVDSIVTGHYVVAGDQLQITMEAVDADQDRVLWHDTVNVPANNLLALQAEVAAMSRGKMASALGITDFVREVAPPPNNEQSYELYLRSTALEFDSTSNQQGIELLRRSVALDPTYAPAWGMLSLRYYNYARFGGGGADIMQLSDAAAEKQLALDPDSPEPVAELAIHQTERGELVKAHQQALELVRRRPDNPNNHHVLNYVLRYGGSIEEAGHQCDMALMLASKFVWGSCSTTWMELGDYQRARQFLRKDLSSEWSKAHGIEVYLRQGRVQDALAIPAPKIPHWDSYKMVLACAAHAPESQIKDLAAHIELDDDPEVNYFFAGHLAYCGQTDAALRMLKLAIDANYCSYPTVDRDPMFDRIRNTQGFARARQAAMACHDDFVNDRERLARK